MHSLTHVSPIDLTQRPKVLNVINKTVCKTTQNNREILRDSSTLTMYEASSTKIDVGTRPAATQQNLKDKYEILRKARRLIKSEAQNDLKAMSIDDPENLYLHHKRCRSNNISTLNAQICRADETE